MGVQGIRGMVMTEVFKIDSEKEIKRIITQSKQAALMALQNYDLDWEQIRFNQLSYTCTFIIETSKEGKFLLRIHAGMSREEIDSELVWLDALNEKMDSTLPKGILDRNGSKTVRINLENGYFGYASLMRWVEGVQPSGGLTEDQIFREGILLAKLHQVSQNFELTSNFIRPYCHHAPDPRETEGLKEEQPYAQAIIKNYLAGAPFLFNAIEI
jgi:Ser/Thr protein kinase RdoA (MazF antagonist)